MKANQFSKAAVARPAVPPQVEKSAPTQREVALRAGTSMLIGGIAMAVGIMGLCGRRII